MAAQEHDLQQPVMAPSDEAGPARTYDPHYSELGISEGRQKFDAVVVKTLTTTLIGSMRHWLAIVNIGLGIFLAGSFAIPWLASMHMTALSTALFHFYGYFCAQVPSHSWHIFGNQMAQ